MSNKKWKEETKKLTLPWEGVEELFRVWSGKGQLFAALAAVVGDDGREWTQKDIERRAHRVLFLRVERSIQQLPTAVRDWLAVLPPVVRRARELSSTLQGGVDWSASRQRGWSPDQFVLRTRKRDVDWELLSMLRWTLTRLLKVCDDATEVERAIADGVQVQLAAAQEFLAHQQLTQVEVGRPDRRSVAAVRQLGAPWGAVADLADELRKEDIDLQQLAREQIEPDESLRYRLFHLGVLGMMLGASYDLGWKTVSLRPLLGGGKPGPAFRLTEPDGRVWELWFEAAALWGVSGVQEAYLQATSGLTVRGTAKGADLLLMDAERTTGFVLECKFSANPSYVREGYSQVLAYLAEMRSSIFANGYAYIVGPAEVVKHPGTGTTYAGDVTFCSPDQLREQLKAKLTTL